MFFSTKQKRNMLAKLAIFSALATLAVNAVPAPHDCAGHCPSQTSPNLGTGTECENNSFECWQGKVRHCNLGTWYIQNDCAAQGLVCFEQDWECIQPWSHFLDNPAPIPTPTPPAVLELPPLGINGVCVDNSFRCHDGGVDQCSFGQWIKINDCAAQGLHCVENDWECVTSDSHVFQNPVASQCPPAVTVTVTSTAPCPTSPTLGSGNQCVNNTHRCGANNTVEICNHGQFITIATCGEGLACNFDYECAPISQ